MKQAPSRPVHKVRAARKPRVSRPPTEPAEPRSTDSSNTLQPLVVFAITASLLTAAAFGYRHLSTSAVADEDNTPAEQAPGFVEAPHIVHSRPAPTGPLSEPTPAPPVVAAAAIASEGPAQAAIVRATPAAPDTSPVTFEAPPPRAVIVEE